MGGGLTAQTSNLYYDVFQQVSGGGAFSKKKQHGDDRLKHCWTQVRVIEGKEVRPAPHPIPHFIVQNGLLYCVAQRRGEEKTLLVVPRAKTEILMELAHPEAVPLRKATAKAIAQELFLLSSRVGIPAEILTDQGTPFMSRLMADLCRLLKVKQLRTTVYLP